MTQIIEAVDNKTIETLGMEPETRNQKPETVTHTPCMRRILPVGPRQVL